MPVPLLAGARDGAAGALVLGAGTCATEGDPTRCGPSAASWTGPGDEVAAPAVADPPGPEARVPAGPEAAQAVSVAAVNRVTVSAVTVLVSRTMFDHIQIRGDQCCFR
jgi:hypothetical protein